MSYLNLMPIIFSIVAGMFLLLRKEFNKRNSLLVFVGVSFVITTVLTIMSLITMQGQEVILFELAKGLPIILSIDAIGMIFAIVTIIVFLCTCFFSFEYMKHENNEKRYYGYFLIVFGVLIGICFAGNIVTFYLFFELLTLTSMPLVLHTGSREAIMAGLKYLFYSLAGAYMALFGIYFVHKHGVTLSFTNGGVFTGQNEIEVSLFLLVAFFMILGFSVKAGMFPMHAWLPTAHPVAPAPASAALSAVIVKAGVLAIIRIVFQIFGASNLSGTWVQTVFSTLTLVTVFMGSMLAFREPVLKKRLAYSTVSQLSYILFGISIMNIDALSGSILHVISHAFIKAALFLCAGAIIYQTGKIRVEELRGIGKEMPLLMWCYTIVSLGLIGIPPTGGFISKWYLAQGALSSKIQVFSWLGPVVLLVSALLTAGYLLPLTIQGFLPGADYDYENLKKNEPTKWMTIPVMVLTILSVIVGIYPNIVITIVKAIGLM